MIHTLITQAITSIDLMYTETGKRRLKRDEKSLAAVTMEPGNTILAQ